MGLKMDQETYWHGITKFTAKEFPEDPTLYVERELIVRLNRFRLLLGKVVVPSPVKGATARFEDGAKDSQHYVNLGRGIKSKAVDIFCSCDPLYAYHTLISSNLFNRIGVYFDTKFGGTPHVMFHVDLKPINVGSLPILWFRDDKYFYVKDFKSYEGFIRALMVKLMARKV